ncbi:MAG TPA: winged helix DNA-binding domain-containing protein [Polyangiales bacterium]
MTSKSMAARRMHQQHLWGEPCSSPEQVVGRFGAMQAQEFAIARWSIVQRTSSTDAAALDAALRDGAILRTHIIRPTWHFVSAADLRWLLTVSAPRVHALNAYYYRKCEIDAKLALRAQKVLARALEGGQQLTRTELAGAFERARITASGMRLAYLLMHAELDGVITSGALRGKQHTYAAFEARVPPGPALTAEQALVELTRRYFATRAPATVRDYARWAGLSLRDAQRGLDAVRTDLLCEEADGRTYWFVPGHDSAPVRSPRIDLVQGYDEYVMSYSESKGVLLPRIDSDKPLADASFLHAILCDGRVAGHFRVVREKRSTSIETRLYQPLSRVATRALDVAVERYAKFEGVPVTRR